MIGMGMREVVCMEFMEICVASDSKIAGNILNNINKPPWYVQNFVRGTEKAPMDCRSIRYLHIFMKINKPIDWMSKNII